MAAIVHTPEQTLPSDRDLGFVGEHRVAVKQVDDREWVTLEPLEYQAKFQRFVIEPGSTTDFASIPRPFTWFIPRYGRYTPAAVLHDHLCRVRVPAGEVTRVEADGVFRQAMRLLGVPFLRRWLMWAGVRLGALRHRTDRRGWAAGGSWRSLVLALLALPVLLPAALIIVVTMPVIYVIEATLWLGLALATSSRRSRQQPAKRVNRPTMRLKL